MSGIRELQTEFSWKPELELGRFCLPKKHC